MQNNQNTDFITSLSDLKNKIKDVDNCNAVYNDQNDALTITTRFILGSDISHSQQDVHNESIMVLRDTSTPADPNGLNIINIYGTLIGKLSSTLCNIISPLLDKRLIKLLSADLISSTTDENNIATASLCFGINTAIVAKANHCVLCINHSSKNPDDWNQMLQILHCDIPFPHAKLLFELYNRHIKAYDNQSEKSIAFNPCLSDLVQELTVAGQKKKEEVLSSKEYGLNYETKCLMKYIQEMLKLEPSRYEGLEQYIDLDRINDEAVSFMDLFDKHISAHSSYYWMDQTQMSESEWKEVQKDSTANWYTVAELYPSESALPFDLTDEDIVSIFGFNRFEAFVDLSAKAK